MFKITGEDLPISCWSTLDLFTCPYLPTSSTCKGCGLLSFLSALGLGKNWEALLSGYWSNLLLWFLIFYEGKTTLKYRFIRIIISLFSKWEILHLKKDYLKKNLPTKTVSSNIMWKQIVIKKPCNTSISHYAAGGKL